MTDTTPAKFTKLVTLLRELFQLDQPDLDFGIYRIMHAKAGEVTQFLERDLLPQVKTAFAGYQTADKSVLQADLAKAIEQAQALGADPDTLPKVQELRQRIANEAVDIGALESETYDHLYSFFRRYYSEGDFLAKRVYKPGVYAIPYEGEEVTLHWANKDQYYIKTSEYLRDYAFRLKPEAGEGEDPMRVRFKLVDAAEGEHGNVKAAEGKDRVFVLAQEDFIAEVGGELELRFEYRPATLEDWPADDREGKKKPPTQKELTALAVQAVLGAGSGYAKWLAELGKPHVKTDGEQADYARLEAHLRRYAARNTFDYFIHKDLGTFLRRELDFYIKNEVMHLDDVESETAPKVEQYLSKIKVVRRIAGKIIDFLAQLENFQKKLWLKKKFVIESSMCVSVGLLPQDLLVEVATSKSQVDDWVTLYAIDELPGYAEPLSEEFLSANTGLMVDTAHFSNCFQTRLSAHLGDLSSKTNGLLIHSDNFQALELLKARYRNTVKCIYIDPPYNKGGENDFAYKDNYPHSSWISMFVDRLESARELMAKDAVLFASIDDNEAQNLARVTEQTGLFGAVRLVPAITNLKGNYDAEGFVSTHEYVVAATVGSLSTLGELEIDEERVEDEWAEDEYGLWKLGDGLRRTGGDAARAKRPKGWFPVFIDCKSRRVYVTDEDELVNTGDHTVWPVNTDGDELSWTWSKAKITREAHNLLVKGEDGAFSIYKKQRPGLSGVPTRKPRSFLYSPEYSSTTGGNVAKEMLGLRVNEFTPKSVNLLADLVEIGSSPNDTVLDFFAGSGTLGHSVIRLGREGKPRNFILADAGVHFDTALLPRIKKALYSADWQNGKPIDRSSVESAVIKVVRLESYEDTLNNLALSRSTQQQAAFDFPAAKAPDALREQYLLRYQLDVESRGSASLLNIAAFTDPTAYKLLVKTPGSDESREVNVDLLETFNWLLGLTVQHIAAPRSFSAEFERDSETRLHVKGRLKQNAAGPWWFRTVTGTTPEGRKTLVIWRKLTGNAEQDNLVLETWFRDKQAFSVRDTEFDLIYVNGDNTLENIRLDDESWKVRLTEQDFQRLMFEGTE